MRVRTARRVVVVIGRIARVDRVKTFGPPTASLDRIAHRVVACDIILLSRETSGSQFVRACVRAFERARVTTSVVVGVGARSIDSNR